MCECPFLIVGEPKWVFSLGEGVGSIIGGMVWYGMVWYTRV